MGNSIPRPFNGDINVPGGGGTLPNPPVPEPASLATLSLCSLALLKRPKK